MAVVAGRAWRRDCPISVRDPPPRSIAGDAAGGEGAGRRAVVGRERQPVAAAALAEDRDLAAPPVDVVQAEPGDLSGPQARPGPPWTARPRPARRRASAFP